MRALKKRLTVPLVYGYRDLHLILYHARYPITLHNSAVGSPRTNGQTNGVKESEKREDSFFHLLFPAGATADE